MSLKADARALEASIERLKAQDRRISELQQSRDKRAEAIEAGKRDLLLTLAEGAGLLAMSPTELVAAFSSIGPGAQRPDPETPAPQEPACKPAVLPELNEGDSVQVTIQYTGHRRGPRVDLLTGLGMRRRAPYGYWSGSVDATGFAQLVQEFPDKVQFDRAEIWSTVDEMRNAKEDVQVVPAEIASGPKVDSEARPNDQSTPGGGTFADESLASELNAEAQIRNDEPEQHSNNPVATPLPRTSFPGLPRRVARTDGAQ